MGFSIFKIKYGFIYGTKPVGKKGGENNVKNINAVG